MPKQILNNEETKGTIRDKINGNFDEIYDETNALEGLINNNTNQINDLGILVGNNTNQINALEVLINNLPTNPDGGTGGTSETWGDSETWNDDATWNDGDIIVGSGEIYTVEEKIKLSEIEVEATADQTGAEIKILYEAESNTNAYTDTEKTKLESIQTGAEVNTINSDVTGIVGADQITNIVSLTQTEYDAIVTPNASTLYIIIN